jgi:hypothetical protein
MWGIGECNGILPGIRIRNSIPRVTPTANLYGAGWLQINIRRGEQLILRIHSAATHFGNKLLTCAAEGVFFAF